MKDERLFKLLANASVCFRRCSNPFSHNELLRNNVTADECKDLSNQIGSIIEEWLSYYMDYKSLKEFMKVIEDEKDKVELRNRT